MQFTSPDGELTTKLERSYLKQMKDERTEIVFSQNTKFDAMKAQAEPDSKDFYDIL